MPVEVAADNDVLIKCACYEMLEDFVEQATDSASVGILGVARYVVRNQLERRPEIRNGPAAVVRFNDFVSVVVQLEPTDEEVEFATAIEEAALGANVPLDTGESQLCSMAIFRAIGTVVTGDKRAIRGLEVLIALMAKLAEIQGRVACLEQLVLTIADQSGGASVRNRICREPDVDKTISICFECTRRDDPATFDPAGLHSYIDDLRSDAPSVLCAGHVLPTT